jgi:hypothetical protein
MMNIGKDNKNKESSQIMTLIPIKKNVDVNKRAGDKRNSHASVSQERCKSNNNNIII